MAANNPERQPGAARFTFGGMNIVNPPDSMPSMKFPYALNCRAYQGGAVGPRLPQGIAVDSSAGGPVHSLQRLNDNNVSPGYGVWVEGIGTGLFVGGAGVATGFSGNRLGMVSYRPSASPRAWMYIADTNKAVKTNALGEAAQTFNTGIAEPQEAAAASDGVILAGGPTYPVFYQYKYRSSATGAQSNPSPPMRVGFTPTAGHVPFIIMVGSGDPQVDLMDIYRQDGGLLNMTYVATVPNGVPFFDNVTDTDLLANPLMQFDDFEPYPSIDLPRAFTAIISSAHILTWQTGDHFNIRWLPGTLLTVSPPSFSWTNPTLTLYTRPLFTTSLEVLEDLTAFIGTTISVTIAEPILAAQRLPALWGPTDNVGYFFSVGDPLRPGTLYFTKGNNPDSAPDTNQIEVCSPSEPLMNGAIVNGLGMVMSTERGWLIYPNFSNSVATVVGVQGSPFQLIETIEGYGLIAKEGICTDGGANLFFWSKSSIRISPGGFGSQSLTDDDLYVLFPHEGQPQESYKLGTFTINPPDYTNTNSFALRFAEGYLYADYQDAQGGYWTLVMDMVTKGWSVDAYAEAAVIHADTQGQGIGTATGCVDGTVRLLSPIGSEPGNNMILATPSFDAGDLRNPKRFIDAYVEAAVQLNDTVSVDLWLSRYTDHENAQLSQASLPSTAGVRAGVILYLANGQGVHSTDMALAFTVPLVPSPTSLLYAWEPTFTDWPELITLWQTDLMTDMPGWKHIKDFNVVYLSTQPVTLSLTFDAQSPTVAPVTLASSGGNKIKQLAIVPANKFKEVAFRFSSNAPFRLWKNDIEVSIGAWGRTDVYKILHPFERAPKV